MKKDKDWFKKKIKKLPIAELAILLCICLLCCTIFFTIYTIKVTSENEASQLDTLSTCLDFVVDSADGLFETAIGLPLENADNNYSLLALSFTSSSYNIAGGALARGKSDLNAMVSNSPLISAAFLYVPNADLVVSSSYTSSNLESSIYKPIILSYENELVDISPLYINSSEGLSLFKVNTDYIVSKDYLRIGESKQSTIFLILDTVEFLNAINGAISDTENITLTLLDPFGDIITTENPYDETLPDIEAATFDDSGTAKTDDGYYLLRRQSIETFITYYISVKQSYVIPTFASILPTAIPFVFLLLILVFIIAVIAVYIMYKPLRKIDSVLGSSAGNLSRDNDSMDDKYQHLSNRISSLVESQNQLRSILQNVSDDVETRMFYDLITGDTSNFDSIGAILNSINSGFNANALYAAVSIRFTSSDSNRNNHYFKEISKLIQQFAQKNDISPKMLHIGNNAYAIIIQFNDINISIINGKKILLNLTRTLNEFINSSKYQAVLATGHMYHSILDVGFSYNEACGILDALSDECCESQLLEEEQSAEISLPSSSISDLISHRSEQLIRTVRNNDDMSQLQELSWQFICELKDSTAGSEELAWGIKELLNQCYGPIVSSEYTIIEQIPDVYSDFSAFCETNHDDAELLQYGNAKILELLSSYHQQVKNQNNSYIIASMEFIKNNYSNPDLTLEDVANNVRLSSTYLSKLFNKCLGIKLFQYLTKYRVDASIDYLVKSDKTVNEIAILTGFASSRNYIRAFKSIYDLTPGDYRKKHSR